ncbi:Thimet oligopeptidase [Sporothrix eucalyptigena]|uniref:Thimet oligopeptidase n=1 Tax=Sporothrix eucalyptigena TaxID=1812306 RepID=A0ABP0BNX6_9PEZI
MAARVLFQALPALIEAEDVILSINSIIAEYKAVRDAVVRDVKPETACFSNVILPLIEVGNHAQGKFAAIAMLRYASPDLAARSASEEALRLFSKSDAEGTTKQDLYLLIRAVKDKEEPLDVESQKYVDELLKDFTRCSHGLLSAEEIKQYLDTRQEIDTLRCQFTRNLMDDTEGLRFDKDGLDGVPEADMQRLYDEAAGSFFVPFQRHDVDAVLKYAKNPVTGKRLYIANDKKLGANVKIFRDVILLRDINARMRGYASHASFRLEKRVAATTA